MLLGIGKSVNVSISGSFGGGHCAKTTAAKSDSCAKPAEPVKNDCDDKCKPENAKGGASITFGVMPLGAVLFGGLAGKLF